LEGRCFVRFTFERLAGSCIIELAGFGDMALKFDIRESLRREIPRIARERIDRVIESLSEKPQPSAESIHEARKDLKCLRAVLRLARGSVNAEVRRRENIFFRDAGRSLSAARDSQALLEALQRFGRRHRPHLQDMTPKQQFMHEFIEKIREKIDQEKIDRLPREMLRKLVQELRGAGRRAGLWFDGTVLEPGNEWGAFVGTGLRRTYRQGKNVVWQFEMIGPENASDETWHELRKCAKALGYQLRLLRPIWPGPINVLLREIDQLTDRLGDDHDLAVLRRRILNEPYSPSENQDSADTRHIFLQSLDRQRRKLQLESLHLARRIYVEKPGQFEHRLAAYWHACKLKSHSKNSKNRGNAGNSNDGALPEVPEPHKPARPQPDVVRH
jgi:CHAD domain-containing protein